MKHLSHDFGDHVCHPGRQLYFGIQLQTPEQSLNPLEDIGECIPAIGNVISRLSGATDVRKANVNEPKMTLTERRTPIAVKIAPAGWYACNIMSTGSSTSQSSTVQTDQSHQTKILCNGLRKVVDDTDCGIEPSDQFVIDATRLV
jgi:hypothetical protein